MTAINEQQGQALLIDFEIVTFGVGRKVEAYGKVAVLAGVNKHKVLAVTSAINYGIAHQAEKLR